MIETDTAKAGIADVSITPSLQKDSVALVSISAASIDFRKSSKFLFKTIPPFCIQLYRTEVPAELHATHS